MTADDNDNRHAARRPSIRVVFDSRSGRILEAHHGWSDTEPHDTEPSDDDDRPRYVEPAHGGEPSAAREHWDAITVPTDELEPGSRYRVDPTTRSLVATDDELGVGFGAGPTGRSS